VARGTAARTEGAAAARASEGGRRPSGGPTWARVDRELGQCEKIQRKMKTGCRRSLGRNVNWASEWISELISRILSSNQKV
jgi:hypothetical protein